MAEIAGAPRQRRLLSSLDDFLKSVVALGRWRVASCIFLMVLGGAFEGVGFIVLAPLLGLAFQGAGSSQPRSAVLHAFSAFGATTPGARLAVLLAAFVGFMLVRAGVLYFRDRDLWRLQTRFIEAERRRAIQALTSARWPDLAAIKHARIVSLMGVEMQRIGGLATFAIQIAVAVVTLVIQTAAAFLLSPSLAALAAAVCLLITLLSLVLTRRLRAIGEDVGAANLALTSLTGAILGGLKQTIAHGSQAGFLAEFAAVQARLRTSQSRYVLGQSRLRLTTSVITAAAAAAVVWAGSAVFSTGPAVLITLILLFSRMAAPLLAIQQGFQQALVALPAFEAARVLEGELTPALSCPALQAEATFPTGDIEFRNLTYRHPGGGGVRGFSARIAAGTIVGLSGPSGAGKTTLIDLLAGLLEPQSGEILLGGHPLDASRRTQWRREIAYVPQDPFLFHDTLRRNLLVAAERTDEAALWTALGVAGADELVRKLTHGLETVIGERGVHLSGGERQRIAIAAALLRRPRLLLLDEATNALDVEAEAALFARLAASPLQPTIVLAAHRAESLAHCTQVLDVSGPAKTFGAADVFSDWSRKV